MRRARTPPSTFLFLPIHLSNSLGRRTPPSNQEGRRSPCPRLEVGDRSPLSVRSSEGASSHRAATRQCEAVYRPGALCLSTTFATVFSRSQRNSFFLSPRRGAHASANQREAIQLGRRDWFSRERTMGITALRRTLAIIFRRLSSPGDKAGRNGPASS